MWPRHHSEGTNRGMSTSKMGIKWDMLWEIRRIYIYIYNILYIYIYSYVYVYMYVCIYIYRMGEYRMGDLLEYHELFVGIMTYDLIVSFINMSCFSPSGMMIPQRFFWVDTLW